MGQQPWSDLLIPESAGRTRIAPKPPGLLGFLGSSLAAAARLMPHAETSGLMVEFANRIEAFGIFDNIESLLGRDSGRQELLELFARASTLGIYRSVWAAEGSAHLYVRARWPEQGDPAGLLRPASSPGIPANLVTVAHVGLGVSAAEHVLADAGVTGLEGAIARFDRIRQANALPGFEKMCVEPLGFVISLLSPGLTTKAAVLAGRLFPDAEDYFWHGVGRAAYFSAADGLPVPGAHERTIRRIEQELPHGAARAGAISGWAWALTLVNIRHPQVIHAALTRAQSISRHGSAVLEGASSGLRIWSEISPTDGLAAAITGGPLRLPAVAGPTADLFGRRPG